MKGPERGKGNQRGKTIILDLEMGRVLRRTSALAACLQTGKK